MNRNIFTGRWIVLGVSCGLAFWLWLFVGLPAVMIFIDFFVGYEGVITSTTLLRIGMLRMGVVIASYLICTGVIYIVFLVVIKRCSAYHYWKHHRY